jgi:hypothetical protein
MRRLIPALALAAALLSAPAAMAGPTCQDRNGDTIRCGTEGAMPVGWTLPARERAPAASEAPSPAALFGLICALGGVFALIALMPDFQGEQGGWDRLEGDDEEAVD